MTIVTLILTDLALDVYRAGADVDDSDPALTIPREDIQSVGVGRRINVTKDNAQIDLDNPDGAYAGEITGGDVIVVTATVASPAVSRSQSRDTSGSYGSASYGGASYGGGGGGTLALSEQQRQWTGRVAGPYQFDRAGPSPTAAGDGGGAGTLGLDPTRQTLSLELADYVSSVLDDRLVYNEFRNERIDDILRSLLSANAPAIDRSGIGDLPERTDYVANGVSLLEVVNDLVMQADAVMSTVHDRLIVQPVDAIDARFTVDHDDIGTYGVQVDPSEVVNEVRIDGGTAPAVESEQTTVDGYRTVSAADRATFQIDMRKSAVDQIELWTRENQDSDSNEDLTVRLQRSNADGTGPVAPDDDTSDIVSKRLSTEFLSHDDFTTFLFADHTLPEPNPWVLVETGGEAGHEIGIDTASGSPAYRAWYRYPVAVRVADAPSISEYGRRQHRIKRENLTTFPEARAFARAVLDHNADPTRQFETPAQSRRAHRLTPGEAVRMPADFDSETASGEYLVSQREDSYASSDSARTVLETTLNFEEVDSL